MPSLDTSKALNLAICACASAIGFICLCSSISDVENSATPISFNVKALASSSLLAISSSVVFPVSSNTGMSSDASADDTPIIAPNIGVPKTKPISADCCPKARIGFCPPAICPTNCSTCIAASPAF